MKYLFRIKTITDNTNAVSENAAPAAVSSGTRKGMTPSSWAIARVNSFVSIVKGRKRMKHDTDLARAERKRRRG